MSYSFWCSKCKKDHAGECETGSAKVSSEGMLKILEDLVKALEAGSYNAAPSKLHQCSQDPPCGCGIKIDGDTATLSYTITLPQPIEFIPLTFQVYRTTVDMDDWIG